MKTAKILLIRPRRFSRMTREVSRGNAAAAILWDCNTQQPRVRKFWGSEQLLPDDIRTKEERNQVFVLCSVLSVGDNSGR